MKASIRDYNECLQAFALAAAHNTALTLTLPEGATRSLGLLYIQQLLAKASEAYPQVTYHFTCDCGDNSALVQAAFRMGFTHVRYTGDTTSAAKLADIAGQYGAILT